MSIHSSLNRNQTDCQQKKAPLRPLAAQVRAPGGRPTFAGIGGAASKEITAAHILDNPPTLQVNLWKKSGGCPLSFKK
jgi:hypothetical protein